MHIFNREISQVCVLLALLLSSCCSDDSDETGGLATASFTIDMSGADIGDGATGRVRTRSGDEALRCVAEFSIGSDSVVMHRAVMAVATSDANVYKVDIPGVPDGSYNLTLWADYCPDTLDVRYDTSNLRAVVKKSGTYDGNAEAAYLTFPFKVSRGVEAQRVTMKSPFARYKVTASDKLKYEAMQRPNDFPDLDNIRVDVTYTGYYPISFNAFTGLPNNAIEGYRYSSKATEQDDGTVLLASDLVFVGASLSSSVNISVTLVDTRTEEVVSKVENVEIGYTSSEETTMTGDILTAGNLGGDIAIDKRWDGEYNIEF